jgi:hypothetical protein
MATHQQSLSRKLFSELVIRSWWVHLFLLGCYWFYAHGMVKKNQSLASLEMRRTTQIEEKQLALQMQRELLLQIKSASDPQWIELTLMRELGVVPEGQTKVHFKKGKP